MDEKTTNLVNILLEKAVAGIETTQQFTIEQAPEVIQQLLKWEFTTSLIMTLIALFLVVVVFIITHIMSKRQHDDFWYTLNIMSLILGTALIVENIAWLKIWIAPKLFLLEYGSALIK